eukprot:TRINITY_DN7385_c0_g1_i2.p1 TRINITY_DN7385_c0_g1~~TRINITY_DN7385_c0_g1_i2.p1  ORF type:complete len:616 (-),score=149.10 TRINITY_DN7385_c0_g1_i2:116-1963(-)
MMISSRKSSLNTEESELSSSPNWATGGNQNAPFESLDTSVEHERQLLDDVDLDREIDEEYWDPDGGTFEDNSEEEIDDENKIGIMRTNSTLVYETDTAEFFRPLLVNDEKERSMVLRQMMKILTDSLNSESKDLIRAHLPRVVRFSAEVPFSDVTHAFAKLVKQIEESRSLMVDPTIPFPSHFIPKRFFPPVNTPDAEIHQVFVDVFLQTGRVSHLDRVLAIHPSYFEKQLGTTTFVMREGGTLPLPWRNYIAILTAARSKCEWMVYIQEEEFILNGGNRKWLEGYQHASKKMKHLMEFITIVTHQPWLLKKDHIDSLVRGEDPWSVAELVHALLIITEVNALVGVIYGTGVTLEIDASSTSSRSHSFEEPEEEEYKEEVSLDTQKITALLLEKGWNNDDDQEQQVANFMKAESLSNLDALKQPAKTDTDSETSSNALVHDMEEPLCHYVSDDWSMQHTDFDVKSKTYSIFRAQDYGWKADGFELVRRFLPGAAALLDEQFEHIYYLTYHTFHETTVDTFPLRRAVWQYVMRVKGIFHDDYNYEQVNQFLNKEIKSYIKKIACQNDHITKSDYRNLVLVLAPDEKVHIALLATESAKQASLLYGLHVITKHIYNR